MPAGRSRSSREGSSQAFTLHPLEVLEAFIPLRRRRPALQHARGRGAGLQPWAFDARFPLGDDPGLRSRMIHAGLIRAARRAIVAAFGAIALPMIGAAAEAGIKSGHALLRVRVTDAATGQPAACVVSLRDGNGEWIVEGEGLRRGFRALGGFTKEIAAGPVQLRVTRGFETRAEERALRLAPGETREVSIELTRQVDLRARGWRAGDSHAHMLHGERTLSVTFDDVALAARSEDLQYLSLAQAWALENPTPESLDAELASRSTPDCVLTWNLEAPKNYYRGDAGRCLGHCWILGMRGRGPGGENALQLLLDASAHDYESEKPTYANFESHALIRELGGAVFYTHPARWWTGAWGGQGAYPRQLRMRISNMAVELPLDVLIGPTFNGIDLITTAGEFEANRKAFELWRLLLNRGHKLAATASSDACFDRPGGAVPGSARTYTYLEGPFSIEAVAEAVAAGRNFVTTGPLLLATVADHPPGAEFPADASPRRLRLEAWPSGADAGGLRRVEVLRNGERWIAWDWESGVGAFQTNVVITESETSWYCARAFGSDTNQQRAFTGAFYFRASDFQPPPSVPFRVRARVIDAATELPIRATLQEVTHLAGLIREGETREAADGEVALTISGWSRLRASAAGYSSETLSPFLDYAPLLQFITTLEADDLLRWETYEETRRLMGEVELTFRLRRK